MEEGFLAQCEHEAFFNGEDDNSLLFGMDFADLGGSIFEKEYVYEAIQRFPTWRLRGIKALGFLTMPVSDPDRQIGFNYRHDRELHIINTARVMEFAMRNNDFPEELIRIGVTAAILHDIAIPAGGDPTIFVDKNNLNEEEWWWEVIDEEGWKYIEEIGSSREEMHAIINNEGLLGQLLDISDRIAYVIVDMSQNTYYPDFKTILNADPKLGNLYKDIVIDRDAERIHISNPRRLGAFLLARARLHQKVYFDPRSMGRDVFFASLFRPFYSPDGSDREKLFPSMLRRMTDEELIRYLTDNIPNYRNLIKTGIEDPIDFSHALERWYPKEWEKFQTLEEGEVRAEEIRQDPSLELIGIKIVRDVNTAVGLLVEDGNGNIITFQEYDPKWTALIQETANSRKGIYVFYNPRAGRAPL